MNRSSLFWSLYHRRNYSHRKCFCLKAHTELYLWDKFWRERKESKIKTYLFNHLMWLAEGWEGRGTAVLATTPFVTRITHRESGMGGCSSHALTHSGLLPHRPAYQRQARQEGCWGKNRKRQLVCGVLEKIQLLPQEPRLSWGSGIFCCLCR